MARSILPVTRLAPLALLLLLAPSCKDSKKPSAPSLPSSALADKCATPRAGTTDRQGTLADEKAWLRAWTDDLYLWYRDVAARTDLDPTLYATPQDYFEVLKSPLTTASGKAKDQFHFLYTAAEWDALQNSAGLGYGMEVALIAASPPRQAIVALVEPNTAAAQASIGRGAEIVSIDGAAMLDGDPGVLNAGLFPSTTAAHSFELRDPGAATTRTVSLTPALVTMNPVRSKVLQTAGGHKVGYLLMNDHMQLAEGQFADAVTALHTAGIEDLVLDLRYNGGGYLLVASQAAYMIAGGTRTSGKIFERIAFNDKFPDRDPVSGGGVLQSFYPYRYFSADPNAQAALPTLSLPRVFVLTGGGTASASESLMNGLAGIDFPVVQVGSTTRGKPYGFYAWDNCGTVYFSIQFQGFNAKGFGDYADGFIPAGSGTATLPGCAVPDDFQHDLGDPAEGRLAAALTYVDTGACPVAPQSALLQSVEAERGWSFSRPALQLLDRR